jgi:glyoxylase-like metal-dependent hydrolase (beta-lactamase superfamily II)
VLESHAGHSGTDIIVRVPEQNVVYTGDLLFSGWYPVCFDEKATISGWRETLKKFAALGKDTLFVPGHGQICGQEGIASIREVFDDIAGQAEKMYHAGVRALCPTSSRIFRSLLADSPSDRRLPSCTRSAGQVAVSPVDAPPASPLHSAELWGDA